MDNYQSVDNEFIVLDTFIVSISGRTANTNKDLTCNSSKAMCVFLF